MKSSKRLIEVFLALVSGLLPAILPGAAFAQLQQSWVRSLDTQSYASKMTLDGQGNVCVAGTSAGNFLTIKYSPDGTQLWSQNFGDSRQESASAIAADSIGQVWVTGGVKDNGLLTIKNDANGALLWARRFDETNYYLSGIVLAVDRAGNAYVAAGSRGEHI